MSRGSQRARLAPFIAAARSDLPADEQLAALLPAAKLEARGQSATEGAARTAVPAAKLITGAGLAVVLAGALVIAVQQPARHDASGAARPGAAGSSATTTTVPRTEPRDPAATIAPPAAVSGARPRAAVPPVASAAVARAAAPALGSARARSRSLRAAPPTAEPSVPAFDPSAESALVERARAALRGDPARTLALTAEHAARFPSGLLVLEREALAIRALGLLGRTGEARARFAVLAARNPRSAHVARLRRMLAARDGSAQ